MNASRLIRLLVAMLLVLSGITLCAGSASSQDVFDQLSDEEAALLLQLLNEGQAAEEAGDFQTALEKYQGAQLLLVTDEYRYREAQCHEGLENWFAAAQIYRELVESSEDERMVSRSQRRLTTLDAILANEPVPLQITTEPTGAAVVLNGDNLGVSGAAAMLANVTPGTHEISVSKDGYTTWTQTITVEVGQAQSVHAQLEVSESVSTGGGGIHVVTWVLGGTAVATGATGLIFGLVAGSKAEDERQADRQTTSREELERLGQDADDAALLSNIFLITAGVLAVATVVTAFVLEGPSNNAGGDVSSARRSVGWAPQVAPILTPQTVGGALSWEF